MWALFPYTGKVWYQDYQSLPSPCFPGVHMSAKSKRKVNNHVRIPVETHVFVAKRGNYKLHPGAVFRIMCCVISVLLQPTGIFPSNVRRLPRFSIRHNYSDFGQEKWKSKKEGGRGRQHGPSKHVVYHVHHLKINAPEENFCGTKKWENLALGIHYLPRPLQYTYILMA